MNKVLQHCSLPSSINSYLTMSSSSKISQHNLKPQHTIQTIYYTYNIPYRPSTAHGLHSFCTQAKQTISVMLSIASTSYIAATHNITHTLCTQWRFQSCQVTWAGDMHGTRGKLMGGETSGPSPYRRALVVLNVGRLCSIVPQDNIVVSNKHN